MFVLVPVLADALILLVVALFTNNVVHHCQYPKNWIRFLSQILCGKYKMPPV